MTLGFWVDRKAFEERLEGKPRELIELIAARAAGRVYPLVSRQVGTDKPFDTLALLAVRAMLAAEFAAKMPSPGARNVARAARAAIRAALAATEADARTATNGAAIAAADAARAAARAAAYAATDAARAASRAVADAARAASINADAPFAAVFQDTELDFDALLLAPLWHKNSAPDCILQAMQDHSNLTERSDDWHFWTRWYRGFLHGAHLDWELQHRVALIDAVIWRAGPNAVAKGIARIEAAYEVERAAAALEESASTALAARRGIGDNNPPSPIDEAIETSDGTTIIWAAAQELRDEAQAPTPKKSRVVKALSAIVGVMKACGLYTAKKADLALNTAIVAATKAAVVSGTAWLALNTDKVQELVDAVVNWLRFLG